MEWCHVLLQFLLTFLPCMPIHQAVLVHKHQLLCLAVEVNTSQMLIVSCSFSLTEPFPARTVNSHKHKQVHQQLICICCDWNYHMHTHMLCHVCSEHVVDSTTSQRKTLLAMDVPTDSNAIAYTNWLHTVAPVSTYWLHTHSHQLVTFPMALHLTLIKSLFP